MKVAINHNTAVSLSEEQKNILDEVCWIWRKLHANKEYYFWQTIKGWNYIDEDACETTINDMLISVELAPIVFNLSFFDYPSCDCWDMEGLYENEYETVYDARCDTMSAADIIDSTIKNYLSNIDAIYGTDYTR